MTTFRKRYSLTFWPHPLGRGYVCRQNICYHVAASVVSFNWICNMTTFRKKYIVWPFDPTPWVEGVSVGKIFATMLLQKSSALIWYATWPYSEKSLILTSAPPPKSTQQARTQAFKLKSRLICFISIAALPVCKISAKNINNCHSYCEI